MKIIFIVLILILFSGCSSKPYVVQYSEGTSTTGGHEIYVVSHGWHTGLVVPAGDIQARLPKLKERFGDIPYIEFGWGDKNSYQAQEITTGLALRAILWPTDTVIHAVAVSKNANEHFPNSEVEKLCLKNGAFFSLTSFISNSFDRDQKGKILELKNRVSDNSQFYESVGKYYLMNTCNHWTAKGLKSARIDISPTFKITASSVMNFIREYNQTARITSECDRSSL
ncbi:MAG: TIGR02117 family protein [Cyanobacteriota bacterium]|nr:TIGR02117 family protein [Cyanobacteriota bacterium]